jgi:hypothetical protein
MLSGLEVPLRHNKSAAFRFRDRKVEVIVQVVPGRGDVIIRQFHWVRRWRSDHDLVAPANRKLN